MIKDLITKVIGGDNLSEADMEQAMAEVFDGKVSSSQIGSFVTALRMKRETVEEITGAAKALRSRALKLKLGNHLLNLDRDDINVEGETLLNTTDTDQEGTSTFNISTATIFVVAGAGIKVARHGNRAASMYFGAADVLANLGVNLDIPVSDVERCVSEVGIGFLFTPLSQGAMRNVAHLREEMGIRTIFNLIGPLANPTGASAHVLGVYESSLTEKMAQVLLNLGAREAFVVYGEGTIDEISICGPTFVSRLKNGEVESFIIEPENYGMKRADRESIKGGDARKNAQIINDVLDGETGPRRDVVVLNAAAAFVAAGVDSILEDGILRAASIIDSGTARKKLNQLVEFSSRCRPFIRKEL
ncbi:MAG: anthranilate phosphoribosyltransferase [Thermodesulfobacteriota bacterium]|nr:anthranilate phosphoribosyltransferase [Thermodesulfobacteriota bacterium]